MILGVLIFLVFVGWSVSYYISLFQFSEDNLNVVVNQQINKILNSISTDVFKIPIKYYSNDNIENAVLKGQNIWYYGKKNSTFVLKEGDILPCKIENDNIYWLTNISSGENYFIIKMSDLDIPMICNSQFSISDFNLTIPWVIEKENLISLTKINEMKKISYENFKEQENIEVDFKIKIEKNNEQIVYGIDPPKGYIKVYSKSFRKKIFETSENANITIMVW